MCGEKSCVVQYVSGECKEYGKITYVCINQTSMLECNTNKTLSCTKGSSCQMSQTGAHCRPSYENTVPSKNYAGVR
jgi:hypothetical protein